jgi:DNA-binding transcriptional MerR regulator
MSHTIEIPNKSSFKVSEVCALTDVKSYVLRFWESEFQEISPLISSAGQKLYEHRDIEVILLIKKLLFEKKMTIEEVKIELKKYSLTSHISDLGSNPNEVYSEDQFISMAKNKLRHILSVTESLQSKYNW